MQWTDEKDMAMLCEVATQGVFSHHYGSRERGDAWQNIAFKLNSIPGFAVTNRAVRDHFNFLARKHKSKRNSEEKATGLGGKSPSEMDILLEDLVQMSEDSDLQQVHDTEQKKAAREKEVEKAKNIRETAMERMSETRKRNSLDDDETPTCSKARRTSTDTMSFLKQKLEIDKDVKLKQLEEQREERIERQQVIQDFQRATLEQQKQSSDTLQSFQQHMKDQSQQQGILQQQMVAMMNQQQQIFLKFLSKD